MLFIEALPQYDRLSKLLVLIPGHFFLVIDLSDQRRCIIVTELHELVNVDPGSIATVKVQEFLQKQVSWHLLKVFEQKLHWLLSSQVLFRKPLVSSRYLTCDAPGFFFEDSQIIRRNGGSKRLMILSRLLLLVFWS